MKNLACLLFLSILISSCTTMQLTGDLHEGTLNNHDFSSTVTMQQIEGLAFIPVSINGVEKQFLLSTGSALTTIDQAFAETLNIQGNNTRSFSKLDKKMADTEMAQLDKIEIGETTFKGVKVSLEDLSAYRKMVPNFGGIIGQTVLKKSNWKIDFAQHTFTFTDQKYKADADETLNTMKVTYDIALHPSILLYTDGRNYSCLLHTASKDGMVLPASRKDAQRLVDENLKIPQAVSTNNQEAGILIRIPQVKLGSSLNINSPTIKVAEVNHASIGLNTLSNYVLFMDNEREELTMISNSKTAKGANTWSAR